MADCKQIPHPLKHNGTARKDRLLPGMQDDYVKLQEHTTADWIVFAAKFTEHLKYLNSEGLPEGDWSVFFNSDEAAVYGTMAVQDTLKYKEQVKKCLEWLRKSENRSDINGAKERLHLIFSLLFSYSINLDKLCALLPETDEVKKAVFQVIAVQLKPLCGRLLAYYKGAIAQPEVLLKRGELKDYAVWGSGIIAAEDCLNTGLHKVWWQPTGSQAVAINSWPEYLTAVSANTAVYGAGSDVFLSIFNAVNHHLFTGIFDTYLMVYAKLTETAARAIEKDLEQRNNHAPHYGLFLAFLKLFQEANSNFNELRKRHLDFYYKQVLRILPERAVPDKVNLIANLAKLAPEAELSEGTLFKGGKDAAGKEKYYALDDTTVFSKAQVAELKALYLSEEADAIDLPDLRGHLFASPVINSADGLGAAFTENIAAWHPFAAKTYADGKLAAINMPSAQIGFIFSSHFLLLREGYREIFIRIATTNNGLLQSDDFDIQLTTDKEWYKPIALPSLTQPVGSINGLSDYVEYKVVLEPEEPSILPYSAAVHGGSFQEKFPMLRMMMRQDATKTNRYVDLRNIEVRGFHLEVRVGMASHEKGRQGLKQIQVYTDAGPADTSKPFMPFGAMPNRDAAFIVGSTELFCKKQATFSVELNWAGISDIISTKISYSASGSATPPTALCSLLEGGSFKPLKSVAIFSGNAQVVSVFGSTPQQVTVNACLPYTSDIVKYNAAAASGFMQFRLNSSLGHKQYLRRYAEYLINKANKITDTEPTEPYTPVLQSVSIRYTAFSETVKFDAVNSNGSDSVKLFHAYPFGHDRVAATNTSLPYLLPQLRQPLAIGGSRLHKAEWYIGFNNLLPQQAVQMLVQVMDGTADPTLTKPTTHLYWSYLTENGWKELPQLNLEDGTAQLLQSGIITLIVPADASYTHTLMTNGLIWFRVAVAEKVNAVCKIMGVHAQAAVATLVIPDSNAGNSEAAFIEAGTISRLKNANASFKEFSQPYPSFGGKPSEPEQDYYIRVSERLRHKNRAITCWDYEHLVLQAFPVLHRVKCLNHTICKDDEYNEWSPGNVTIIAIPDLKQRNDINPLKPYTSQGLLAQVYCYLKARVNCQIQLHVVNPDFEEVKVRCKIHLRTGYNDFSYYAKKLQEELTAWLCPWAFGGTEIEFGKFLHRSAVINFIEERPYVDYLTDLEVFHFDANGQPVALQDDTVRPKYAKSILVSVPATEHEFEEIPAGENPGNTDC